MTRWHVCVRDGMQRLTDLADEMDEKGEVAGWSHFALISDARGRRGVFIDF